MSDTSTPLHEHVCVVTGGTRGIGRATALGLARLGASVLVVGNQAGEGAEVLGELFAIAPTAAHEFLVADLSEMSQVRDVAERIAARQARVDVLINNAGMMADTRRCTVDGYEATLALNLLAPALLTTSLLPLLSRSRPGRVVNVSSIAYRMGRFDLADPHRERGYSALGAYSQSKLGLLLWTRELARRLDPERVTVNALHPGIVGTKLGDWRGFISRLMGVARPLLRDEASAALTSIHLAASPEVIGTTGQYFVRCRVRTPSARGRDDALAAKVWDFVAAATVPEPTTRG